MKPLAARTHLLARALMYVGLLVIAYFTLRRLAIILAPVGTGLFLAYLLDPWVTRLQKRRVPRGAAVALLLLILVGLVSLVVLFVPPLLQREIHAFTSRWEQYRARIDLTFVPWLRARLHLPDASASLTDTLGNIFGYLGETLQGATGDIASAALGALRTASGVLRLLVAVLLTPVFAIYFLKDYPTLAASARAMIPPRHRDRVIEIVDEVNHALASWLRGQLTVMLILAAAYAIGLSVAGIPLGIGIGILTGLLAFVPYVGVFIGLFLALAAALLDYHGAGPLVGVLLTFGVVQAVDTLVITPRVLGGQVGLSPVAVIFALTLGGELLGYAGLLLAVPAAAVCKVLWGRARRAYLASQLYRGEATPVARPEPERATEPEEKPQSAVKEAS